MTYIAQCANSLRRDQGELAGNDISDILALTDAGNILLRRGTAIVMLNSDGEILHAFAPEEGLAGTLTLLNTATTTVGEDITLLYKRSLPNVLEEPVAYRVNSAGDPWVLGSRRKRFRIYRRTRVRNYPRAACRVT